MKQNIPTQQLAYSIEQTARLFGKDNRSFVYRAAKRGDLQIVKVGLRSAAVTSASIDAYAKKCGIPLPASI